MARDRTARARIRELLAANGPVIDPSGYATGELKDAIDYQGSNTAFIQLIAAMERDQEIVREIRGKRTYRISAHPETPTAAPPSGSGGVPAGIELDYAALARALMREMWQTAEAISLAEQTDAPTAGMDYRRRLEAARQKLDEVLAESVDS